VKVALGTAAAIAVVSLAGFGARALAASPHLRPALVLSHSGCAGHQRWDVKTLTDDEADKVNKTARTTTVDELRANETRPAKVSAKVGRIRPVEVRRYRVHATLRKAFREDDGDLHVVVHDPHHDAEAEPEHTMIIEFPDTSCEPQQSSSYAPQMGKARAAFVALVRRCTDYKGKFGSLVRFKLHATITGVGFWDVKHAKAQLGHASNDIELHPVLKVTRGSCS
jgi:hypothetical protein